MASGKLSTVVNHLHKLAVGAQTSDASDAHLLERFIARRDEAAFAALVKRHGPMVLAVCRRVLGNHADAEDAFQATFLVLVRKAVSLRRREALANWLHGVALNVALRARTSACTRRRHEQRVPDMPQQDFLVTIVWRDLQPILDEEVQALPESCREAFVLCYLEGKTYEEAARQLSCPTGTLSRRLARARKLLQARLSRRGLVLPAGMLALALSQKTAPATVPAALIASTVKAALKSAAGTAMAGAISARVAALADGGLQAMKASKTKVAFGLLFAVGLVCAGAAGLAHSNPAATIIAEQKTRTASPEQTAGAKNAAVQPDTKGDLLAGDPAKMMAVSGQVVSADGKPVPGAAVALVAGVKKAGRAQRSFYGFKTLTEGKTDAEGKFALSVSGISADTYWQIGLIARAAGHGLFLERLALEPGRVSVKLALPGEHALRGRLVDLQGQPAAGVKVQLATAVGRPSADKPLVLYPQQLPAGANYWPQPVVSDANGHFLFKWVPAGCDLTLDIMGEGATFARQMLAVKRDEAARKELAFSLAPGRLLEGTVTYRDTGKPVPHARLQIDARKQHPEGGFQIYTVTARADANGRYRVVPYDGSTFVIEATPPADQPYLLARENVELPRGVVQKHEVNLSLRRGILVRGVVTERPSGKPVAGASVDFMPRTSNNPFYTRDVQFASDVKTDADGKFTMVVLPGPGHLLVNGPTPDYVHATILTQDLLGPDHRPNRRWYPDALVRLDLKPDVSTHQVKATLQRGVTLKGRVLGPDGQTVARGQLFCRTYVVRGYTLNGAMSLPFKDGRFALAGWDPARPAPICFFSPELGLGGVLQIKSGQGDQQPTIRLQKCGAAKVRIVDDKGKPFANERVVVTVVLTPGHSVFDPGSPFNLKGASADVAHLANFDRKNFNTLRTDANGRVELRNLIPGARHWLVVSRPRGGMIRLPLDLVPEAGKALDLKEITIPNSK